MDAVTFWHAFKQSVLYDGDAERPVRVEIDGAKYDVVSVARNDEAVEVTIVAVPVA